MSDTLIRYTMLDAHRMPVLPGFDPHGAWVRYNDAHAALTRAEQTSREVIDGMAEEIQELRQAREAAEQQRDNERDIHDAALSIWQAVAHKYENDRDIEATARQEAESKLDTLRRQIGDNTALLWITAERDTLRAQLAKLTSE